MKNTNRPLNVAWISLTALGAGAIGYATYLRNASVANAEAALSQAQFLDVAGWIALSAALVLGILALTISHDNRGRGTTGEPTESTARAAAPTAVPTEAPTAVSAAPAKPQLDVSPAPAAA